MPSETTIRQLTVADYAGLSFLTQNAEYIHRHLDWRGPLDWLGASPFLGMERQRRLLAVLACPHDTSDIGWIRLFAFLNWNQPQLQETWDALFQAICQSIDPTPNYQLAGLGLHPWFTALLRRSGFIHRQNIVVLQWADQIPPARPLPDELSIRKMGFQDLDQVEHVDHLAFDSLWRMTHLELELAFQQAVYATVAELQGEIVAYQISTGSQFHAHLARLAVDPGLQRLSIGYATVRDLLAHFRREGIPNITVNTQSDNAPSLSLYHKIGFVESGDEFPVFVYPLY